MAGPKIHKITDDNKAQVIALKSFGTTHEEIALFLGMSADTLTRDYAHELATAQVYANAKVAGKLYSKAVEGDDLTAQIFWLKTRGRWRTEDTRNLLESNDELKQELKDLRAELNKKHKKEY